MYSIACSVNWERSAMRTNCSCRAVSGSLQDPSTERPEGERHAHETDSRERREALSKRPDLPPARDQRPEGSSR